MATRWWFGGTGAWTISSTTVWSQAAPVTITASCTGTTLTVTSGNASLVTGMTVRSNTGVSLGTISAPSGSNWTVSVGGTYASQSMTAATVGVAGSVPTAADPVIFNAPYAQTVTLTGALLCLDFTVSTSNTTFTSTGTIAISGSMDLATTTTWSATGTITFNATTSKTIFSRGTTFSCNMTFNGVGGTWQLQDDLSLAATQTVTLTNGTIDLNSKKLAIGFFSSSSSNARGVKFGTGGTGNITVNGASGTLWTTATFTNFTVTDTPIVNISSTATGATAILVSTGIQTESNSFSYYFTSGSYTLTFLATSGYAVKSVTFNGFTGSFSGTSTSTLYGGLTISPASSTMTWTGGLAVITFGATSGTWDIDTNGKAIDQSFTFGVSGTATWRLLSDFISGTSTTASARATTLTIGTLNLNNFTYTGGTFSSSNSNARTLAFGTTGALTLVAAGGVTWTTATFTNWAVSGTPTVNIINPSSTTTTVTTGNMSEAQSVSFYISGPFGYTISLTAGSKRSLNFNGFGGTINNSLQTIYGDLILYNSLGSNATLSGQTTTWTLGGTTANPSRKIDLANSSFTAPIVFNAPGCTFVWQRDYTLLSNYTWTDGGFDLNGKTITATNLVSAVGATGNMYANGGRFNVTGNNATVVNSGFNLTFIEAVPVYLTYSGSVGTRTLNIGAAFSETAQYGYSLYFSGGATDTVNPTNLTIMDLNTTGFSGTLDFGAVGNINISGNLNFASGSVTTTSSKDICFRGNAGGVQYTISSASTFPSFNSIIFRNGSNNILNNNITVSGAFNDNGLIMSGGSTINLNGRTITASTVSLDSVAGASVINMASGTITVTGDNTLAASRYVWNNTGPGTLTCNGTGTINFRSASTKTIGPNGGTFPTINQGGTGQLILSGASTVDDLTSTATSATSITLPSSVTTTFTNFSLSGTSTAQVTLNSSTAGTQATISKSSGIINALYLTIKDIAATGGATWNAYTTNGNVNNGNNAGWIFAAALAVLGQFFSFF